MILFISGLPGSGKSTIGRLVAKKLGWKFIEADKSLTKKMKLQIKEGKLLTSEQLDYWIIDNVIPSIIKAEQIQPTVVAGMLAKKKYVKKLSKNASKIIYINLLVPYKVLMKRIISRDHFAKEKMLDECWSIKEDFILPGPIVNANQITNKILDNIISLISKVN